jgi:hypothetical protein
MEQDQRQNREIGLDAAIIENRVVVVNVGVVNVGVEKRGATVNLPTKSVASLPLLVVLRASYTG